MFISYTFIEFMAIVLLVYYMVPARHQWKILLIASWTFYLWACPEGFAGILSATVCTWYAGRSIGAVREREEKFLTDGKGKLSGEERKAHHEKCRKQSRKRMLLGIVFNIGILAVVKYSNFLIGNVNGILSLTGVRQRLEYISIIIPLGISFYTFQTVGYLIDVHRGTVRAEKSFWRLALFVSFFPQLVQGPISGFGKLKETLFAEHTFRRETVLAGLQRVLWGFFKKVVIADRMLIGVNTLIRNTDQYQGAYVFAGMMFYALELYADFTGGIDIAIGAAQMFGVTVTENFQRPYFSKNIKEYWNRWHISLGSWFKEYVFYPLSVCGPMRKLSKWSRKRLGDAVGKKIVIYLSSFAVWFLTGIWHGASWNFIAWGLGNWLVITISQELEPLYRRFHKKFSVREMWGYRLFQVIRTVLLMSTLRLFDCYRNVSEAFWMFGSIFVRKNWNIFWNGALLRIGLSAADYGILFAGTAVMTAVSLLQRSGSVRAKIATLPFWLKWGLWYGLFLTVLLGGIYGSGYEKTQFIYNQF